LHAGAGVEFVRHGARGSRHRRIQEERTARRRDEAASEVRHFQFKFRVNFTFLREDLMRRQQWFLAIGMVVALSSIADAALRHRYSFTSDASDSVGGANGTVVDPGVPTAAFAGGKLDLTANVGNGSNNIVEDAFVDLPNGIVTAATNGG